MKRLLRAFVTSETYQKYLSWHSSVGECAPENRLLARGPRHRLAVEFHLDHALATGGLLVRKMGGPGVHPYQPAVLFEANAIGSSRAKFSQSKDNHLYRRSLYTY